MGTANGDVAASAPRTYRAPLDTKNGCIATDREGVLHVGMDGCNTMWIYAGGCVELWVTNAVSSVALLVYDGTDVRSPMLPGNNGPWMKNGTFGEETVRSSSTEVMVSVLPSEITFVRYREAPCAAPPACDAFTTCASCMYAHRACVWRDGRCTESDAWSVEADAAAAADACAAEMHEQLLAPLQALRVFPPVDNTTSRSEACRRGGVSCCEGVLCAVVMQHFEGGAPQLGNLPAMRIVDFFEYPGCPPLHEWPRLRRYSVRRFDQARCAMPDAWPEWPELVAFRVSDVLFEGVVPPWREWPQLVSLSFSQCTLARGFPPFRAWPDIQSIDVSLNPAMGGPLGDLYEWPHAQTISVRGSGASGPIKEFFAWPNLGDLTLSANDISGTLPPLPSGSWPRLTQITLSNNPSLGGTMPIHDDWHLLGTLDLSFTDIRAFSTNSLQHTGLISLRIQHAGFTGLFPDLPRSVTSIQAQHNHFSGTIPGSCFTAVSEKARKSVVNLSFNHFTAIDLNTDLENIHVVSLDLSYNELTTIPAEVLAVDTADISHNRIAMITGNQVTGRLTFLSASHNQLIDASLERTFDFMQENALAQLDISHNFLTRLPFTWVSALPGHSTSPVAVLHASHNQIANDQDYLNEMPQFLHSLVVLDLSDNRLPNTSIPATWAGLEKLTTLRLDRSGMHQGDPAAEPLHCTDTPPVCIPSFLNVTDVAEISGEGTRLCWGLQAREETDLEVHIDNGYFDNTNCLCRRDFFTFDNTTTECTACVENAQCPGGMFQHVVAAHRNFYGSPSPVAPQRMIRCKQQGVCNPTGAVEDFFEHVCARGHTGRLCSRCEAGYFELGGECQHCGGAHVAWMLPTLFLLAIVCYIAYLFVTQPSQNGVLKITLFFLQLVRLLPTLGAPLPGAMLGVAQGTAPVSLHLSGLQCWRASFDFSEHVVLVAVLPLAIVAVVALVYAAGQCAPIRQRYWRQTNMRVLLFLLFSAYLYMATVVLRALPCERDPVLREFFFVAAPDLRCGPTIGSSPPARKLAVVLVFTHVVGIPALLGGLLFRFRHSRDDERVEALIGFLYKGYREHAYWWESVVLLRRVALAVVLATVSSESAMLPLLVALVLLAALVLQVRVRPFKRADDNELEAASIVVLLVLFSGAVAFYDNHLQGKEELAASLAVVTLGMIARLLYTLLSRRKKKMRKGLEVELLDRGSGSDGESET